MTGSKRRSWLYAGVVVNLLLWMSVFAKEYAGIGSVSTRNLAIAGFVLAALSQHWAYYTLWNVPRGTAAPE